MDLSTAIDVKLGSLDVSSIFYGSQEIWNISRLGPQIGQAIPGPRFFGRSMVFNDSAEILAIGSPYYVGTNWEGLARVFAYTGTNWEQLGGDFFGETNDEACELTLNAAGDILAIGARQQHNNGNGYTKILQWDGSAWSQLGATILGPEQSSFSGQSIALNASGGIIAIGEPGFGGGSNYGQVRVFEFNGTAWAQKGSSLNLSPQGYNAGFRVFISDAGHTVGVSGNGKVRIYNWGSGAWVLSFEFTDPVFDSFDDTEMTAMSPDGNTIILSSWRHGESVNGYSAGFFKIFKNENGNWSQKGSDVNGDPGDLLIGAAISPLADRLLAVAGRTGGEPPGYVRLFNWTGSMWEPEQKIKLSRGSSGWSVATDINLSVLAQSISDKVIVSHL